MKFSPSVWLMVLGSLGMVIGLRGASAVTPLADDPTTTAQDRVFMARAQELAVSAVKHGNQPFGALLVKDGKVLFEYENTTVSTKDVTKHAESGLISAATPKFDRATLEACTLYASTEPCIMCCGAIRWAGVRKVVYGVTASQLTRVIGLPDDAHPLEVREVFARTEPTVKVVGPVGEAAGLAIHAAYWPNDPVLGKKP